MASFKGDRKHRSYLSLEGLLKSHRMRGHVKQITIALFRKISSATEAR